MGSSLDLDNKVNTIKLHHLHYYGIKFDSFKYSISFAMLVTFFAGLVNVSMLIRTFLEYSVYPKFLSFQLADFILNC